MLPGIKYPLFGVKRSDLYEISLRVCNITGPLAPWLCHRRHHGNCPFTRYLLPGSVHSGVIFHTQGNFVMPVDPFRIPERLACHMFEIRPSEQEKQCSVFLQKYVDRILILFDLKSQHIPVKPDHCGHVLYKYSESFQFHLFYLPFCTLLTGLAAASAYRSSPYNPPDTEYVHGLRHCYACKYSRFSRIILEKKRHIIRVHRHVPWPVKLSWNDIF